MRAITNRRFGTPDVLRLEELPTPKPEADEVLIEVGVSAVTPSDCAARSGKPWFARLAFGPIRPRAIVVGGECAGVIEAVGEDVTRFAEGDRVVAGAPTFGAHAEYLCVRESAAIAPIPETLSDEVAVAVSEGGLTALPFLRDHAHLQAGRSVLVNGASGSVGAAAVQLAKMMGANVTGVCSTSNLGLVRSLGADRVIDYTQEDFTDARSAYDVIFDAVGKSSFRRCRRALKPGGVYLTTVPSIAILVQMLLTRLGGRRAGIAFTGLRPPGDRAADLVHLLDLAATGRIAAVVDRSYPLEQAADAHRYVDRGHKRGTVILTVAE